MTETSDLKSNNQQGLDLSLLLQRFVNCCHLQANLFPLACLWQLFKCRRICHYC